MIMKKTVVALITIIVTMSFSSGKRTKNKLSSLRQSKGYTLNGFDYPSARKMIDFFDTTYTNDKGRKSFCAWFSKAEIAVMQKALQEEVANVDGVRLYFGADSKIGTKLQNIKLFLISTTKRARPAKGLSVHGDYEEHESYLNKNLGQYYSNKCGTVLGMGGVLYGDTRPNPGPLCIGNIRHQMGGSNTYNWIQRRHDQKKFSRPNSRDRDSSAYNTESEWFEVCFVSSLFTAISDPGNNIDGLRIYMGNGFKLQSFKKRDVFIMVPTRAEGNKHVDNLGCLKLLSAYRSCKILQRPNAPHPSERVMNELFNERYFVLKATMGVMDGGYDKGELCPTICN